VRFFTNLAQLRGRADGAEISAVVRELLAPMS